MWIKAMLVAFFLNGTSSYGLRILAGMGVGEEFTPIYLFYWYAAGMMFILVWALFRREPLTAKALLIGSCMALFSVGGQVSLGLALAYGAPGNVVFPISQGSSICIVAAGGFLFFKERVSYYGIAGILLGLTAAVLLSIGG
jgi:multidrug transporter EmrE-like cation transporter